MMCVCPWHYEIRSYLDVQNPRKSKVFVQAVDVCSFSWEYSSELGDPLDHPWGQRLPPKTDCLMTEACQSSQTLQNKFLIFFDRLINGGFKRGPSSTVL